jgi:hypothetical protein
MVPNVYADGEVFVGIKVDYKAVQKSDPQTNQEYEWEKFECTDKFYKENRFKMKFIEVPPPASDNIPTQEDVSGNIHLSCYLKLETGEKSDNIIRRRNELITVDSNDADHKINIKTGDGITEVASGIVFSSPAGEISKLVLKCGVPLLLIVGGGVWMYMRHKNKILEEKIAEQRSRNKGWMKRMFRKVNS